MKLRTLQGLDRYYPDLLAAMLAMPVLQSERQFKQMRLSDSIWEEHLQMLVDTA